ncbi:MAG: ankyrin repeat domain-containing protein [Epsilonproteobacteria bacterium]|nr:ankyrin repeat domain-containing protein [Campylobacterota bacterium]
MLHTGQKTRFSSILLLLFGFLYLPTTVFAQEELNENLLTAVVRQRLSGVQQALRAGADVNASNRIGSALVNAAFLGGDDIVLELLNAGANASAAESGTNISVLAHAFTAVLPVSTLERILQAGADVNMQNTINGSSVMHLVMRYGQNYYGDNKDAVLTAILAQNPNLNIFDNQGKTPLHIAFENENAGDFATLISNGADVNAKAQTGQSVRELYDALIQQGSTTLTPSTQQFLKAIAQDMTRQAPGRPQKTPEELSQDLLTAINVGDLNLVRQALDDGADVQTSDRFGSALFNAILSPNRSDNIITEIINRGADTNARRPRSEESALMLSLLEGISIDIIRLLLANGADVNYQQSRFFKETALHIAANYPQLNIYPNNNQEIIQLLLNNNANPNVFDRSKSSPLHIAFYNRDIQTFSLLMNNGANLDAKAERGLSVRELYQDLVAQAPADANTQSFLKAIAQHFPSPRTPEELSQDLLQAIEDGNLSDLRQALNAGANIETADSDGTALLNAITSPNMSPDIIAELVNRNANVRAVVPHTQESALMLALLEGLPLATIRLLVENDADPNYQQPSFYRETALHIIANHEQLNIYPNDNNAVLQLLLDNGANPNVFDRSNSTPLHIAFYNRSAQTFSALVTGGADLDQKAGRNLSVRELYQDLVAQGPRRPQEQGFLKAIASHFQAQAPQAVQKTQAELDQALLDAINAVNINDVRQALSDGANIEAKRNDMPALYYAVSIARSKFQNNQDHTGMDAIISELITRGADVDAMERGSGYSEPYLMKVDDSYGIVREGPIGAAPSTLALLLNRTTIINTFFQGSFLINFVRKNETLYTSAQIEQIYDLIFASSVSPAASLNLSDNSGITALHQAFRNRSVINVRKLIEKGADINYAVGQGRIPPVLDLYNQDRQSTDPAVQTFIKAVAQYFPAPQRTQAEVNKELLDAITRNDLNTVTDLFAGTPAPETETTNNVGTALANAVTQAVARNEQGRSVATLNQIIQLLIDNRANVNAVHPTSQKSIFLLAFGAPESTLKKLVDAGADVSYQKPQRPGNTFLHELVKRGVVQYSFYDFPLITDRPNRANVKAFYETELGKVYKLLFDNNVNVNVQNQNTPPETPLSIAIDRRSPLIFEELLAYGGQVGQVERDLYDEYRRDGIATSFLDMIASHFPAPQDAPTGWHVDNGRAMYNDVDATGLAPGFARIEVASDGRVWGQGTDSRIYARLGITSSSPQGTRWHEVGRNIDANSLVIKTVGGDEVFGATHNNTNIVAEAGKNMQPGWTEESNYKNTSSFTYPPVTYITESKTGPYRWQLTTNDRSVIAFTSDQMACRVNLATDAYNTENRYEIFLNTYYLNRYVNIIMKYTAGRGSPEQLMMTDSNPNSSGPHNLWIAPIVSNNTLQLIIGQGNNPGDSNEIIARVTDDNNPHTNARYFALTGEVNSQPTRFTNIRQVTTTSPLDFSPVVPAGPDELFNAIDAGDLAAVRQALDRGVDIEAKRNGTPALYYAVNIARDKFQNNQPYNDVENIIRELLSQGADPDAVDNASSGIREPFIVKTTDSTITVGLPGGVLGAAPSTVELLVDAVSDINVTDSTNQRNSFMTNFIQKGEDLYTPAQIQEIYNILFDSSIVNPAPSLEITGRFGRTTLLHTAFFNGKTVHFLQLMSHGADVNATNAQNMSVLDLYRDYRVQGRETAFLDSIAQHFPAPQRTQAEVNKELLDAITRNDLNTVTDLFAGTPAPETETTNNVGTALANAVAQAVARNEQGRSVTTLNQIIQLLIDNRANVNAVHPTSQKSIFLLAFGAPESTLKKLVDAGADVSYQQPQRPGNTFLHELVKRGAVQYSFSDPSLLSNPTSDANLKAFYQTELGKIYRLLFSNNVAINTQNQNTPPETPLSIAIEKRSPLIFDELLANGGQIGQVERDMYQDYRTNNISTAFLDIIASHFQAQAPQTGQKTQAELDQALLDAINAANINDVRQALNDGANIEAKRNDMPALYYAVSIARNKFQNNQDHTGMDAIISELITRGADVDAMERGSGYSEPYLMKVDDSYGIVREGPIGAAPSTLALLLNRTTIINTFFQGSFLINFVRKNETLYTSAQIEQIYDLIFASSVSPAADFNLSGMFGRTALHQAFTDRSVINVRKLIEKGADINYALGHGRGLPSVLDLYNQDRQSTDPVVQAFIKAVAQYFPAPPRAQAELDRDLIGALQQNNLTDVRQAFSDGATIQATDGDGSGVVINAIRGIVLKVINNDASDNQVLREVLDRGGRPNELEAGSNYSPLMRALGAPASTFQILLDEQANIDYQLPASARSQAGMNIMHMMFEGSEYYGDRETDELAVFDLLVARGAQVNVLNGRGETPLHLVFKMNMDLYPNRRQIIFDRLIAAGADINLKASGGQSVADLYNADRQAGRRTDFLDSIAQHFPASRGSRGVPGGGGPQAAANFAWTATNGSGWSLSDDDAPTVTDVHNTRYDKLDGTSLDISDYGGGNKRIIYTTDAGNDVDLTDSRNNPGLVNLFVITDTDTYAKKVWGQNNKGQIFARHGITQSNPQGTGWIMLGTFEPGSLQVRTVNGDQLFSANYVRASRADWRSPLVLTQIANPPVIVAETGRSTQADWVDIQTYKSSNEIKLYPIKYWQISSDAGPYRDAWQIPATGSHQITFTSNTPRCLLHFVEEKFQLNKQYLISSLGYGQDAGNIRKLDSGYIDNDFTADVRLHTPSGQNEYKFWIQILRQNNSLEIVFGQGENPGDINEVIGRSTDNNPLNIRHFFFEGPTPLTNDIYHYTNIAVEPVTTPTPSTQTTATNFVWTGADGSGWRLGDTLGSDGERNIIYRTTAGNEIDVTNNLARMGTGLKSLFVVNDGQTVWGQKADGKIFARFDIASQKPEGSAWGGLGEQFEPDSLARDTINGNDVFVARYNGIDMVAEAGTSFHPGWVERTNYQNQNTVTVYPIGHVYKTTEAPYRWQLSTRARSFITFTSSSPRCFVSFCDQQQATLTRYQIDINSFEQGVNKIYITKTRAPGQIPTFLAIVDGGNTQLTGPQNYWAGAIVKRNSVELVVGQGNNPGDPSEVIAHTTDDDNPYTNVRYISFGLPPLSTTPITFSNISEYISPRAINFSQTGPLSSYTYQLPAPGERPGFAPYQWELTGNVVTLSFETDQPSVRVNLSPDQTDDQIYQVQLPGAGPTDAASIIKYDVNAPSNPVAMLFGPRQVGHMTPAEVSSGNAKYWIRIAKSSGSIDIRVGKGDAGRGEFMSGTDTDNPFDVNWAALAGYGARTNFTNIELTEITRGRGSTVRGGIPLRGGTQLGI